MCKTCGNLLTDVGPCCRDCLPVPPVRVLNDACDDCHLSETGCAAHWAVENQPCCTGCSHG